MKRRLLRILAVLALIALAVFILLRPRHDSQAPYFVPGSPASIPPINRDGYEFLADAPFENDRMWIWTGIARRFDHLYLYDLRQKKVVGELFNAQMPDLSSRDGSRLLVKGFEPFSLRQRLLAPVLKLFGKLFAPPPRTESLWVVDTSRNSAERVGSLSQYPGEDSAWHPSPDFRYGYTVPATTQGGALYLCDLEQPSLKRIPIPGYPRGWWDEHDILIGMGNNQFDLLDIRTKTTRSLFSAADFQTLLAKSAITNIPPAIDTVANWNGTNFDFYFAIQDGIRGLKGSNSFVLRASADSPQLALLYREFQFRWGGHFDREGKHYLYPGESSQRGRGGNGAVYLLDYTSGVVSTIVPPDNLGGYSIPQFYGNEAIYTHIGQIHRVGLDGSNDAVVLSTNGK